MEGEYQGRVKDGKLHGVGVCLYTDGSRYQGDWKAGLKSGRGTHSFASGDQFEGEWENGWMHGLGVYTWKIGDKYIGEVRAALRRLSGPAEDSCLACAAQRPAACDSVHLRRACTPHSPTRRSAAQKRGMRCSTRGASLRANSPAPACVNSTGSLPVCVSHAGGRWPDAPDGHAGAVWADPRLRHVHVAHGQQVRRAVEGG